MRAAATSADNIAEFARQRRVEFGLLGAPPPPKRSANGGNANAIDLVGKPHRVTDTVTLDNSWLTRAIPDDPHDVELVRRARVTSFFEADALKGQFVVLHEIVSLAR